MKKLLALVLSVLTLFSAFVLTSCSAKTLKFGVGIVSSYAKAEDAKKDVQGTGEAIETIAAVLVDADGKIVACKVDTADLIVGYTADGKAIKASSFKTKGELGKDYNMAKYGQDANGDGKVLEWFEQADALCKTVVGKTTDEVKAMAIDGKPNEDIVNAGCTINVADFIKAVVLAMENAKESEATAEDTIKISTVTTQKTTDASKDADGSNAVETTFAAVVVNADGKVVTSAVDCVSATFAFDKKGKAKTDIATELKSKAQAGENYGMSKYGQDLNEDGKVLEWNEQAEAFQTAIVGKNADEIGKLVTDKGYGVDELQTAGCTIAISDIVNAVVNAMK